MTKKQVDPGPWVGSPWETLLPRQWWFWSRRLRAVVLAHCFRLAFPFLQWVHVLRKELADREMIAVRQIPLADPRAPATWEVDWISCEKLAELVAAWQVDEWDIEWHRKHAATPCQL
jgi:hypothetical protein